MLNRAQHLSRLDLFVVYKLKALKKLLTFSKVSNFIIGGQKFSFTWDILWPTCSLSLMSFLF
jgi:hypothetical protein